MANIEHKDLTGANLHGNNTSATGEIYGLTDKPTPIDADVAIIEDSIASWAKKKLTWANIKVTLKAYFDGIYATSVAATTLLSINLINDLQPILDFVGQIGLLELNSNGDLQPTTGSNSDYTLELDGNGDIRPK